MDEGFWTILSCPKVFITIVKIQASIQEGVMRECVMNKGIYSIGLGESVLSVIQNMYNLINSQTVTFIVFDFKF